MLALARNEGQSIIIDGNIEVKVVKWSRSSVRLAIQAPRQVTVDRDEVWRKMHPGEHTPLEKAEAERNERFAREGGTAVPKAAVGEVAVTAPAAGIFYASAGPGGTDFVAVGSAVEAGAVVGLVKADEKMVEVHAGAAGSLVKILVTHGKLVAAGDILMMVKASGEKG